MIRFEYIESLGLKPSEFGGHVQSGDEVAKAIHGFAERITHKSISLSGNLTVSSELNPQRTDYRKLIYCYQILFDNAVYWAKDSVNVELVELEDESYNKALLISNNGEPISESEICNLFTKTESKRKFGGNGVGLFIAKLLSKQGGFEVFYDRSKEYGENTTFVIKWMSR